jgi:hypothetical protein
LSHTAPRVSWPQRCKTGFGKAPKGRV